MRATNTSKTAYSCFIIWGKKAANTRGLIGCINQAYSDTGVTPGIASGKGMMWGQSTYAKLSHVSEFRAGA